MVVPFGSAGGWAARSSARRVVVGVRRLRAAVEIAQPR
jgi:hypothetical protein